MLLAPLAAPLADLAIPASAAPGKMVLSIHQTTSQRAGYRKILEGWAKAGISFTGLTMVVMNGKFVGYAAFDSMKDSNRAAEILADLGTH